MITKIALSSIFKFKKNLVINEFEESELFDKELSSSKTKLRREISKIIEIKFSKSDL